MYPWFSVAALMFSIYSQTRSAYLESFYRQIFSKPNLANVTLVISAIFPVEYRCILTGPRGPTSYFRMFEIRIMTA